MMGDLAGPVQQAKLVLLGDMGAGKSSLVLRFVKGQFFDYQVGTHKVGLVLVAGQQWLIWRLACGLVAVVLALSSCIVLLPASHELLSPFSFLASWATPLVLPRLLPTRGTDVKNVRD